MRFSSVCIIFLLLIVLDCLAAAKSRVRSMRNRNIEVKSTRNENPPGIPPAVWTYLQNKPTSISSQRTSMISAQIVNGTAVKIEKFPYQLSMRVRGDKINGHFCGASILNKHFVLTAAHCAFLPLNKTEFLAGSTRRDGIGFTFQPSLMIKHPDFNNITLDFDICIYKTNSTIPNNTYIAPIALIAKDYDVPAGTDSTVSGWGALSSGNNFLPSSLMAVSVPIVSRETCREKYGSTSITDNMICAGFSAGGKDSCQGDSGGPLVIIQHNKTVLIGVVSWGDGCALPNLPGVYTNVAALRTWIDKNSKV